MINSKKSHLYIYDSTLRDGVQGEYLSFSTADKIAIAACLDDFGVSYIEGGWAAANSTDIDFFREIKNIPKKYSKICVFGCTRKKNTLVENDSQMIAMLETEAPVCTIVGKCSILQVKDVLQTNAEENLRMVFDTISLLKKEGREVHFDAEHFFDGYLADMNYASAVINTAMEAGADCITLCDTNGGMLPMNIEKVIKSLLSDIPNIPMVGIHCHNDSGVATANSLISVSCGITLIQGCINGIGERCGNANLIEIIPGLELKMKMKCLPEGHLALLKSVSDFVFERANQQSESHAPYVGNSAFTHKGGLHVDAIAKNPFTFEHVQPECVGNRRRILVSELSGRHSLILKANELGLKLSDSLLSDAALAELKKKEKLGYEYESAEASFVALMYRIVNLWPTYFISLDFRVIVEKRNNQGKVVSEATVKLKVDDQICLSVAEGDGPVNALDLALRKSLEPFYPDIKNVFLIDYKVRILESSNGTAAQTRVRIQSSDSKNTWDTVGVSENIIEASWIALIDSVEYALFTKHIKPFLHGD